METRIENDIHFARVLREAGFRATFGRVALLEALEKAKRPLTVGELAQKLRKHLDQATAYRALEAFEGKGIVRRIDLGHDHAHYELAEGKHHHHLVCDSCGKVEDVEIAEKDIEHAALRTARDFKSVRTHSLEFFGMCRACTA